MRGKIQNEGFNRREFLRNSAVAAGAVALTGYVNVSCTPQQGDKEAIQSKTQNGASIAGYQYQAELQNGEWFFNVCPRNCYDTCAIKTKVVDGRIVELRGDESNPYTAGGLCVKTQHYIDYHYHQDRVLYPMRRVGAKGPGSSFERISWDEAIDTIVAKWSQIIEEDGPEAIVPCTFSGTFGLVQGCFWTAYFRLFYRMGAAVPLPTMCLAAGMASLAYNFGYERSVDPEAYPNSKLYVSWGINESASTMHSVKFVKQCQKNGGKIAVVSPIHTPMCDWADMHIQIRGGTDTAFALAVANILIKENLYSREYVEAHTVGFDELVAKAAEWPAERAAEVCGVPEQQVIDFAHLYAQNSPSMLRIGYNLQRRTNGGMLVRAILFLPALMGQIGVDDSAGFNYATTCYWGLDLDSISKGEHFLGQAPPGEGIVNRMDRRTVNCADLGHHLLGSSDPEHNYATPKARAVYIFNGNPSTSWPNGNMVRDGLLQEDMFVVVHDIFVTDTADYADIILPSTTLFECEDIHQSYHSLYLLHNNVTLQPMGECKTNLETSQLLAKAMGYNDPEFRASFKDIVDEALSNNYAGYQGLTYDSLCENNFIKVKYETPYASELENGFTTPSGKIEFASDKMIEWGHVTRVADYVPDRESYDGDPGLYAKYPLSLLSCNTAKMLNGSFYNLADTRFIFGEPFIYLHPEDAQGRGLNEGDYARIFNDRGEFFRTVRIEPGYVRKGSAVALKSIWSKFDDGRINANATTPSHIADFGYGACQQSNLVEIEKA